MTRIAVLILCSLLSTKGSYCQTDVYTKTINNCFKIEGYKDGKLTKTGSGFILFKSQSNNYDCLTNEHVLDNIDSAVLQFSNDKKYIVQGIKATFHNIDISYFSFSTTDLFDGLLTKNWAKQMLSTTPQLGTNVITVSSPKGLLNTLSTGIISAFRKKDETNLIQITAPISPGSSGGLLADTKGNPIGVIVSHISEGQNLNFAISFKQIFETLINKKLLTQELVAKITPLYAIKDLEMIIIDNDEQLKQLNKHLASNRDYGNELLIQYDDERLTAGLLFTKISVLIDKKDWNNSFETLLYYKRKYNDIVADFLLSAITAKLMTKPNEIGAINNAYILFLRNSEEEYWLIFYNFLKGLYNFSSEDYFEAITNLEKVAKFIYMYSVDESPQNLNKKYFATLFWAKTLNSLSFAFLKAKNIQAAKETSLKGIIFSYTLKEPKLLEVFGDRYLAAAIYLEDDQEACFTYKRYLSGITFSSDLNYFINKYCK